jgi:hypothetical protein
MVLKVSAARVATLTWVLIFGGMLALALGLVVGRSDAALGVGIVVVSVAAIAVGVLLVWVRSRMKEDERR